MEKVILDRSFTRHVVDIAIEELMLVVEYDGIFWHNSSEKISYDRSKSVALLEAGWRVIRLRECSARTYLPPLQIDDWSFGEMPCSSLSKGAAYDHDIIMLDSLIKRVTSIQRAPNTTPKTYPKETTLVVESTDDLQKALTIGRTISGLTQQSAADSINVHRTYLNRMESGDIDVLYMKRMLDLFKLYGATVTVSFDGDKTSDAT